MAKALYLTTTLPYVNADPHIGFALELVQADIYVRFRALQGDDVFFNTGVDEHGLKIFRKALEEGKEPQAYVDEYASKFRALKEKLNLYPDIHFIRTTDPNHVHAAQEFWKRCEASGDIYKKNYQVKYCVGCETEKTESELVDGYCPLHPHMELEIIDEENYFFRLSKYQDQLRQYLARESVILPEWRREEAQLFVDRGLEDFSISRMREKMPWGISVPGDESHVMYVWFDALVNYISTLGWPDDTDGNFKKFWAEGETLQLAGKDQVRFQSVMWQAMLMSAGVPTTHRIVYHGFITSGGQKMSKSLGNVIDPMDIVKEYGVDTLRYFLARHISSFEDSDFTMERFREAYNADLANGLGNTTARVMKLAQDNLERPIEHPAGDSFVKEYTDALDRFDYNAATNHVWERITGLDQRLTIEKPFAVLKDEPERGRAMITELAAELYLIARMLQPIMPSTSDTIKAAILANKKSENLFPRLVA